MTIEEIRQKARDLGVCPDALTKTELIREIQRAEGYRDCYRREDGKCPNRECCWWHDCRQPGFNT